MALRAISKYDIVKNKHACKKHIKSIIKCFKEVKSYK